MSPEPLHVALQSWQNFYLLAGTAASTLTGLMFVAVTFGAGLITRDTATAARAFIDPIYRHFAQVLLTACLVTIPTIGSTLLGALFVFIGVIRVGGLVWVFRRYREAHARSGDVEASDWLAAIVLPFLVHVLLVATGAGFLLDHAAALTGLAVVTTALLFLGLYGAWELVTWMAVAVSERGARPADRE